MTDAPVPKEPLRVVPDTVRKQPPPTGNRPALKSTELLAGATAVEIEHLGQIYRLQTTRAGKLILTK